MNSLSQALSLEGRALHHAGQLTQAQQKYDQALQIQPDNAETLLLLGALAYQTGDLVRAAELIAKSVAINPGNAGAFCNLGVVQNSLKRHREAVASYDRAIALRSDYADAFSNRGNALNALKQYADAINSYDRALALNPALVEAHYNRATALIELGRHSVAIGGYDRAIALRPTFAAAHYNRGDCLYTLHKHQAAVESYDRAIALRPDHALTHYNRGNALFDLRQYAAAVASYDRAIGIDAKQPDVFANRGNALREMRQYGAAVDSYDQALAIKPGIEGVYGVRLHSRMNACDWRGIADEIDELTNRIEAGWDSTPPFCVLGISSDPALQLRAAQHWAAAKHPADEALGPIAPRPPGSKIRIAYFSADFRNHSVSFLTAGLFEAHDRTRFEVIGFSFGPDTQDDMRCRLEAGFDTFVDVRGKSDTDIASLARSMNIDIAIDLASFTQGSRTGIFALRAAPVQVSYLGYPGTMGAPYMDYLIADPVLIPPDCRRHYAEKIMVLPSFQVNDSQRPISDRVFTRETLGLPQTGFVFCCFNNSYKITPLTFASWMRILARVEGSVLLLYAENDQMPDNLHREAVQAGIAPQRLVFTGLLPPADYLARYRCADLFLDTLPYNAGTTASDALRMGLPLLTCTGDALASRMAASLLTAMDVPDLITSTEAGYEDLAVELATNAARLQLIKTRLQRNRPTAALFDTVGFARHLEAAFSKAFERHLAGLPPDHIVVEAQGIAKA